MAKRNPRLACVDVDKRGKERLTAIGIAHVLEMATLGCEIPEIARYLRVSPAWIADILNEDSDAFDQDAADAFDDGKGAFTKRLREHQLALSESNAQMAIHLGKQVLGQHERKEIDISSKIQIVGTLPDYSQSADDWARSFAPTALQGQKVIEAEIEDAVLATTEESSDEARSKD